MKTSESVCSAASQNGSKRRSPRYTPRTLAPTSTPASFPSTAQREQFGGGELGVLQRHGAERGHPVRVLAGDPGQGVVLDPAPLEAGARLGIRVEQRHPGADHDPVDPGPRLDREQRLDVDGLVDHRADLAAVELDHLSPALAMNAWAPQLTRMAVAQQLRNDHVHVGVDYVDRALTPSAGEPELSASVRPRSARITVAAFRPGAPVIDPPGCVVPPV